MHCPICGKELEGEPVLYEERTTYDLWCLNCGKALIVSTQTTFYGSTLFLLTWKL